ncbi:hypothetical protein ACFY8W_13790 [Streptomyces sp. NPDC012637]|uniref:hypothetical protein n=1 Tax=Streptomyces sp. NPDC012637 TaxID=3364842 RepID=UPI0036E2444C
MSSGIRRRLLARSAGIIAAVALAITATPLAGTAQADSAVSGSFSFSGEPGEPISGGQSYAYTAGAVQLFDVEAGSNEQGLTVAVDAAEGTLWRLLISAPEGQKLTAGTTYTGAKKWPYIQPGDPGLEFSGIDNGTEKWCSTPTSGSFTIENIAFGPYGYVSELDATFEQYCNGTALRGEVHAVMPEAPEELAIGVNLAATGTVDTQTGVITVGGDVTCNKPARFTFRASAYQIQKHATASGVNGEDAFFVDCTPGAPVPWTVSFPSNLEPDAAFKPGAAVLRARGEAPDRDYPVTQYTGDLSRDITLVKS